jgi:hypothetical protein
MPHISHSLNDQRNLSEAGAELWALYNTLADDYSDAELLGRFDAYVDDLSLEAQDLYRKLAK